MSTSGLPGATRLGRVRLQVADLERSLGFYKGVLGFRTLNLRGGRATLGARGDAAPLVELHERSGLAPVPQRGRLGLYHFATLLPDRAALGRLVAHLAERRVPLGASDHLVSEALYLQDPDGLGIEVYADRPPDRWRYDRGQLVMDTRPLDLAALVRAAEGERWTGMPPGTVIGHVHLHVGDVERAVRFYEGALGLERTVWSYPGAIFLSAGGYHHHLGINSWAGPGATPAASDEARLLDWEIVLPNADAAHAAARRLTAAGFSTDRAADGWQVSDPWGTALCIVSPGAHPNTVADETR